ncbi:hypothetical protein pdam_00007475 [Pocillopora damicornis]|uniref:SGNH hydrolase-type esterase domain-containing protein n=1 Tax=Pocillopora damicornis TaxID=46731 RepID=A0A3M6TGR0_POCDA|nr:hypothetical protein pdam_00007475 [Pocillopora damicornis]
MLNNDRCSPDNRLSEYCDRFQLTDIVTVLTRITDTSSTLLDFYADDTTGYSSNLCPSTLKINLQNNVGLLASWFCENFLAINHSKSQSIVFNRATLPTPFVIDSNELDYVTHVKLLGVVIDNSLSFNVNIKEVCRKVNTKVSILHRIHKFIPSDGLSAKLESTNAFALRTLLNYSKLTAYEELLKTANIKSLEHRRIEQALILVYKSIHNQTPNYIQKIISLRSNGYSLRGHFKVVLPRPTSSYISSRSTKSSSNGEDSHSGANNNNERARKPVTVIAGDSIIQHIRGWSISRSNQVVVKSFPGATTEDIEDFVKPLLRKKPDNVFLHIGTNDLNTQEPRLTVEGIVNLALQIEGDAPETNLAISGLIARADDKDVKVSSVNKIFKKFCRQNHWNFIEHNNINQTHLNRGGLHLSKSGSALLAQNLLSHIDDLRIFTSQSKGIDILAINETKLDSIIKDNEVHLPDNVNTNSSHLLNIMDIYGLTQLITEPTRVTQHSRTLINLCLTNSPDKISNSGVVDIGISDHCAIFLTQNFTFSLFCS